MKFSGRSIQPPPRSSLSGTVIIIMHTILFSLLQFSPQVRPWILLSAVLLSVASLLTRQLQAFHFSILTVLIAAVPLLDPAMARWPFILLVPVVFYFALALPVPRLRSSLLWLRRGRLGPDIMALVAATSLLSGAALYLWHRWLRPDLSIHLQSMPAMPAWAFPLASLAFSFGNAAVEEIVFRGIVMQAVDSACGPRIASVLLQGWLFGAMHYLRGFPNGLWGVAMATVYGILLGTIRRQSRGMFAPWLTHVLADIVIFTIVAGIVLK